MTAELALIRRAKRDCFPIGIPRSDRHFGSSQARETLVVPHILLQERDLPGEDSVVHCQVEFPVFDHQDARTRRSIDEGQEAADAVPETVE